MEHLFVLLNRQSILEFSVIFHFSFEKRDAHSAVLHIPQFGDVDVSTGDPHL
jgi:hypothetical protein